MAYDYYKGIRVRITKKSKLWALWKFWFPKADWRNMFVAFGRTIFTPNGTLPNDLWIHERTHLEQQDFSYLKALVWHFKYRFSGEFRYSQELEAYTNQMRWIEDQNISFKDKHYYRQKIAELLSGPMYGNMTTYEEAFKALGVSQK